MIGMELCSLNNLIKRYFENRTHKKEVDKITGRNGWIIGYLSENADKDIYQKDLEKVFSITRSTTSKVLNLMEQKGLIKRQNVSCDARLRKLILTEKALKIHEIMKKDSEKMEETFTKDFTEEELNNLYTYIQKMKNNIK